MSFRHSHDTQYIVMTTYCKRYVLVYEKYTKLIATHVRELDLAMCFPIFEW